MCPGRSRRRAARLTRRGAPALVVAAVSLVVSSAASAQASGSSEQPDLADGAFARGTELLLARCAQLKAGYEGGDRRVAVLREVSDCYLVEADLARADGLRRDAERLEAEHSDGEVAAGAAALDLTSLRAQWEDACRSFERSHELEPSSGAQLAVALCRLRQGKLTSCRTMVEQMLPQMGALAAGGDAFHQNRLSLAQALLQELERVQPRLTLRVETSPAPELSIDGHPVMADQPAPLDVGTYRVAARRGDALASMTITLRERSAFALTVTQDAPPSLRRWHVTTWALASGAAAAGLVGGGAWWYAERRLSAFERLGGTERSDLVCAAGPDADACAEAADDVNRWRTVRFAGLVTAGALALSAGAVWMVTPKARPSLRWIPAVDRGQVALSVGGGF